MWIKKYNKKGNLSESVQTNTKGETISYYSVNENEFIKFNIWGKDKCFEYRISEEELELIENIDGERFFRSVSKNNKKGGINYPVYTKKFFVENKNILDFNIDKNKLGKWKEKAIKKN